jgi:cyanophycinase-like exopeptidase
LPKFRRSLGILADVSLPRLLVLIGSGELAAQMTRGHRMLVQRLIGERGRAADVKATVIDTPYGFQENADSLSETLVDYFERRIGMKTSLASFRGAATSAVERETAFAHVHDADFVFSGPGSPSYALRHWKGSALPGILADKLRDGGAVVFASAAALTLGRLTVPVYEIYKGGSDPYWLSGLDVLSAIGISAAVIPHYDNAEGAGHDTRYCFLGERRLQALESQMPAETFILGIDEHTALLIDIDEGWGYVHGRGGVTIRRRGDSEVVTSGERIRLGALTSDARATSTAEAVHDGSGEEEVATLARRVLDLERGAAALDERSRIVEPLIATLIDLRAAARGRGDYATADMIRERLNGLGVELTDAADGATEFRLLPR